MDHLCVKTDKIRRNEEDIQDLWAAVEKINDRILREKTMQILQLLGIVATMVIAALGLALK